MPRAKAFKGYPNNADILLYYSKSDQIIWNRPFQPHDQSYVENFYKYVEPETGRRYTLGDLTNPNHDRPNLTYEFLGVNRVWRWTRERMQEAYDQGLVIQQRPGSVPRLKRYLDEMPGNPVDTIWDDIKPVQAGSSEQVGYPTQKPIALLERIIQASSNEGDVVLDPFCGCATALIAAEKLGRQWIGIDLSPVARTLVQRRMANELGFDSLGVIYRDDIPRRTDIEKPPPYRTQKHTLFGIQEGICTGCKFLFPFRNFTIDHIVPRVRGGTDHVDNLQLLCNACNSVKGTKTQAEFMAALRAR